jgi:hypothetical protein
MPCTNKLQIRGLRRIGRDAVKPADTTFIFCLHRVHYSFAVDGSKTRIGGEIARAAGQAAPESGAACNIQQ